MKYLFGILILLSLCSCSSTDHNSEKNEIQTARTESNKEQFRKENEVIKRRLKGKKFAFLDSAKLAGSSPKMENTLIFLAKKTDCSSCTSKALEVLHSFSTVNINRLSIKIGYSDVGGYSNTFEYSFDDTKGVIQDELGYFHTPALILYGHEGVISSYLVPTYEDSIGLTNYLETVYEAL